MAARRSAIPKSSRPKIRGPVQAGILIMLLFFGLFGTWAAVAPLESAAIAPGVITVDSNRKTIQHLEGGIVAEILVRDGDIVETGQVLVRLQGIQARATQELLAGRRVAVTAQEARLIAERDGAEAVEFPQWLRNAPAQSGAADALAAQRNIFQARRVSQQSQRAILQQTVAQLKEEIIGLRGEISSENRQLGFIGDELSDLRTLVEKGLARKPRLLALERQAADIEGSRSQNRARIARARQRMNESELRMAELINQFQNEVVVDLSAVQDRLSDLVEQVRASDDILTRTEVVAPLAGTIVNSNFFTEGGVIAAGAPIMDIVPADDELIVEAFVDPADIDVVRAGLRSEVRISALNRRSQTPIAATVTSVSADLIQDPQNQRAYYLAKVAFAEDPLTRTGGIPPYPGMQAEVIIVTGASTPLQYLVGPITRSLRRAMREN